MRIFAGRPLLVSAWSNRVLPDALGARIWPASTVVLQPDRRSRLHRSFFAALAGREPWPAAKRAVLGRSVTAMLHPVAVAAVPHLVGRRSGQHSAHEPREDAERIDSKMSRQLANWLWDVNASEGKGSVANPLPYLFTSGAQRAKAMAIALRHTAHRPLEHLVDIGTGVGLIPWLLRWDFPSVRTIDLIEPRQHYIAALSHLWRDDLHGPSCAVTQATAEESELPPADLIMLSHCLLLIAAPERGLVLRRAWKALQPGGVLLVNETFRDSSAPDSAGPELVHCDELTAMLPRNACIFTRRTGWRKPQSLDSVTARAAGHTGMIIAVRD